MAMNSSAYRQETLHSRSILLTITYRLEKAYVLFCPIVVVIEFKKLFIFSLYDGGKHSSTSSVV